MDVYKGSDKTDLYESCNDQGVPELDFKSMFCQRCRNHSCVNAGWSWSSWEERISTQEDRLLVNPKFAEVEDPRFDRVREQDFPVLLQEAIRLNSGVDWEAPAGIVLPPATTPMDTQHPRNDRLKGVVITTPIPINTDVPDSGVVVGSGGVVDPWEVPREKKVKVGATLQFQSSGTQLTPPPK